MGPSLSRKHGVDVPCRGAATADLKGLPVVQLEFHAEAVPWLLAEPEPM